MSMDEKIKDREAKVAQEREDFRQEQIARGIAFEEMMKTNGWKYVQAYIENSIKRFGSKIILKGYSTISDLNLERGEILGLRQLLEVIDASVNTLNEERRRTAKSESQVSESPVE